MRLSESVSLTKIGCAIASRCLDAICQVAIEHLVGVIPRNKLDVWRAQLEPGVGAGMEGTEAWQFHGEMVMLIEEGIVDVNIGRETFVVAAVFKPC